MYIFSRAVQLGVGDPRQQAAWAAAITEKANQISETPILLWSSFASSQTTLLAWSTQVPSLAVLEALEDKANADDGYLGLVAEGAKHIVPGTLTDSLIEVLYASGEPDVGRLRYVTVGTATASPGNAARAAEVGIRMTQRMSEVTGVPCSLGVNVTGLPNTFQIAGYMESIGQVEQAGQKIRSDRSLLELFDGEASEVFLPAAGEMVIVRRVL